jgi:predicted N-acetyltransferase YhbS
MGTVDGFCGRISSPERLNADHDLTQFTSGETSLDHWLRNRALQNEMGGASRSYVVRADGCVVGYYALAAGAVAHTEVLARIKRNMPDPIPVVLIGRLAVDSRFQGRGIGADLLRDAILRSLQTAQIIGIRAILVSAISTEAKKFYERFGFISSSSNPQTLMITVSEAAKFFAQSD